MNLHTLLMIVAALSAIWLICAPECRIEPSKKDKQEAPEDDSTKQALELEA